MTPEKKNTSATRRNLPLGNCAPGCAPTIAQDRQFAHLYADVPFVRAALFYDGTWQPRPGVAVGLLFLLRAGVADLDRALIRELAVVVLVLVHARSFLEPDGNVCHYRLHRGESMHSYIQP
jgi:hypothetical protein